MASSFSLRFLIYLFFIFRERGREGERDGKKHQCVGASCVPPTGDPACNPGMCPDWELNWRPFVSQVSAQSTEPYQPGLFLSVTVYFASCIFYIVFYIFIYFKDFIYLFLKREEGREKERERNINVQLPLRRPLLGTWPATP